jgi:hypothetical protein
MNGYIKYAVEKAHAINKAEAQQIANIALAVQLEVLHARMQALRKYTLNNKSLWEADIIEHQIEELTKD